jgi:G8 domain
MLFDVAETPILDYLEINGRLIFDDKGNRKLNVKNIFVREGQLIIGGDGVTSVPFHFNATITLYGLPNDETVAVEN